MRGRSWRTLGAALACLLALAPSALAADGDLDASFGGDGVRTHACDLDSPGGTHGRNVARTAGGRILLLTTGLTEGGDRAACVTRLTAAGQVDPSFGDGGDALITAGAPAFEPTALAVQPDGGIVVAGTLTTGPPESRAVEAIVARLEAGGALDTGFGDGGMKVFSYAPGADRGRFPSRVADVAVQPDGRIVVTGRFVGDYQIIAGVARLTTDGELDPTFHEDGARGLNLGGDLSWANAVTVQGDRIVIAGRGSPPDDPYSTAWSQFAAARFNADGSIDSSFGTGGRARVQRMAPGSTSSAVSDAIATPDGGLLLTGTVREEYSGPTWGALLRLDANGKPESAFSGDGILLFDGGVLSSASASTLTADGSIAVTGRGANGESFAIAKLTQAGTFVPSFADGGHRTYPSALGMGSPNTIIRQPDGKLLVGAVAANAGAVARVLDSQPAPAPDGPDQPDDPAPGPQPAPLPILNVTGGSAVEGQILPFSATLSRPSDQPVTFDYITGSGHASTDRDFGGRRGTLTIPAGQTSIVIGIPTNPDRFFEADEDFRVELSNPQGARFGEYVAFGTIVNDLRSGRCANIVIGRRGTDIITGSSAGDRIVGRQDQDFLFGLGGPDCIYGERGHDIIDAGPGDDLVDGGSGDDRIKGGDGDDRIYGRRGRNRYNAGAGDDRVYARNGVAEIVECGPGRDQVKADSRDRLRRCERVTR